MNLSAVATSVGAATQPAVNTWQVTSPVARGFQTVLYLRLNTQGAPDGIEIDATACQFAAVFQPLTYNALNAPPIPAASRQLSSDGKAVIINVHGARQVTGVTLNPSAAFTLHRADGLVQADKAADASNFIDVNFAVQAASPIAANQVTAVNVRSNPGSPRIGIAATDLQSPAMFWPTPASAGQLNVQAGDAFAKALQAYVTAQLASAKKNNQPLAHIDVAIVIQSDNPCVLAITQCNVRFHQLLSSLPDGGEKTILRYAGKSVERPSIALKLPATASVASATMRVSESFHPGGASQLGDDPDLAKPSPIAETQGFRLTAGDTRSAGQYIPAQTASSVTGIALALVALEPGTVLQIELQTDQNATPSGKKLAQTQITLSTIGQQQWSIASFPTPVTLPGSPFWILVSASKGSALWLLEGSEDSAWSFTNDGGILQQPSKLDGFQPLSKLLLAATATPDAEGQPTPTSAPGMGLSLGISSIPATTQADGTRLFDLTSQLNKFLSTAHAQAPGNATATIPLIFTSGAAGLITVYPPHITFDVS